MAVFSLLTANGIEKHFSINGVKINSMHQTTSRSEEYLCGQNTKDNRKLYIPEQNNTIYTKNNETFNPKTCNLTR